MRRIMVTALVVSGLALTGCGSEDDDPKPPAGAPQNPGSQAPAARQPTGGAGGGAPQLTPQQRTAYLNALRPIDPKFAAKADEVIQVAGQVCQDLKKPGMNVAGAAGAATARLWRLGINLDMDPSKRFVRVTQRHVCK